MSNPKPSDRKVVRVSETRILTGLSDVETVRFCVLKTDYKPDTHQPFTRVMAECVDKSEAQLIADALNSGPLKLFTVDIASAFAEADAVAINRHVISDVYIYEGKIIAVDVDKRRWELPLQQVAIMDGMAHAKDLSGVSLFMQFGRNGPLTQDHFPTAVESPNDHT